MLSDPKPNRPDVLRTWLAAALVLAVAACGADEANQGEAGAETEAAGAETDATAAAGPASLTIADVGLQTPESVLHDEAADVYLVSNINGSPLEKDDNGFISRVSPTGGVDALMWIDGAAEDVTLHAPKGLAVRGDSLFVTDIDVVRIFHRVTGEPMGEWAVDGATFLNDLAIGPAGALYATDSGLRAGAEGFEPSGTDAVYRFADDGTATALVRSTDLTAPNGVIVDEQGAIVVTFGANLAHRIGADGTSEVAAELPAGQLDGVVRLADGTLLVSSWEAEAVYRVDPATGEATAAVEGVPAPADIGYDHTRDRVLIPVFTGNSIEIRTVQ